MTLNSRVINRTLEYSLKNIIIQGVSSPDASGLVKTDNETLGTITINSDGTISQQVFQHAFSKTKTLPITIEIQDENADPISLNSEAEHNKVVEIDTLLLYHYNLSGI